MRPELGKVEINVDSADGYEQLRSQRQQTLVAPEDDMWAAFADMASPHSLTVGTRLAGRFSVEEGHKIHGFFVIDEFEEAATEWFAQVVDELNISAAMASTVDPRFLSLSLTEGGPAQPVALMYDHTARATCDETVGVRLAASEVITRPP